jgi:hypothetical protein
MLLYPDLICMGTMCSSYVIYDIQTYFGVQENDHAMYIYKPFINDEHNTLGTGEGSLDSYYQSISVSPLCGELGIAR